MVLFMEFSPGRTQTLSFKLELACLQKYLTKVKDLLLGKEQQQPMRTPAKGAVCTQFKFDLAITGQTSGNLILWQDPWAGAQRSNSHAV